MAVVLTIVLMTTSVLLVTISSTTQARNVMSEKRLSRQKRYLAFPEGASLSVGLCMTAQTGITPGEIYTEAINWAISYELPNDTKIFKESLFVPKKEMQRRHRRDLYQKMETIMNSMGYDGRGCILRALCEASGILQPRESSLVHQILGIIFRYPEENNPNAIDNGKSDKEQGKKEKYQMASKNGAKLGENDECFEMYPKCSFSLLDMALGYYSTFNG